MPESKKRKPKKGNRPSPNATPPVKAKAKAPSPTWFVVTMSSLMGVGLILVLIRFVLQLDQWVLVLGLAMIAGGFLMTTSYR